MLRAIEARSCVCFAAHHTSDFVDFSLSVNIYTYTCRSILFVLRSFAKVWCAFLSLLCVYVFSLSGEETKSAYQIQRHNQLTCLRARTPYDAKANRIEELIPFSALDCFLLREFLCYHKCPALPLMSLVFRNDSWAAMPDWCWGGTVGLVPILVWFRNFRHSTACFQKLIGLHRTLRNISDEQQSSEPLTLHAVYSLCAVA